MIFHDISYSFRREWEKPVCKPSYIFFCGREERKKLDIVITFCYQQTYGSTKKDLNKFLNPFYYENSNIHLH